MPFSSSLGSIALLGSGETSLSGGRIFESLAQSLPPPLRIIILETPAGFELNSTQVAGRVADFLETRLQNYDPVVTVLPARKRGTPFSPDNAELLIPLLSASMVFMGPGSPTYAVRQLRGSLAWDILRARHRMGAALVFASAATVAVGVRALPVYEIYKVGEEVSAPPGLDLFADFGLPLSFIPHWNNAEGGADVDTSRCFIGMERFDEWCALLPPGHTTVGLDEHTGLVFDFALGQCRVSGVSSVTLLRECNPKIYPAGATFSFAELGVHRLPAFPEEGIPASTWKMVVDAAAPTQANGEIPAEVLRLADVRQQARIRKDWVTADGLRKQIEALGWRVEDTPAGPKLDRK